MDPKAAKHITLWWFVGTFVAAVLVMLYGFNTSNLVLLSYTQDAATTLSNLAANNWVFSLLALAAIVLAINYWTGDGYKHLDLTDQQDMEQQPSANQNTGWRQQQQQSYPTEQPRRFKNKQRQHV